MKLAFSRSRFSGTAKVAVLLAAAVAALAAVIVLPLARAQQSTSGGPVVTTDKSDYAPGSTAAITGSGFAATENVELQVVHVDAGPNDNNSYVAHDPWMVKADETGSFTTTWDVPADQDELGATLLLTAYGLTSQSLASVTFTDGPADTRSISPNTASYGAAVAYTVSLTASSDVASKAFTVDVPSGMSVKVTGTSGSPASDDPRTGNAYFKYDYANSSSTVLKFYTTDSNVVFRKSGTPPAGITYVSSLSVSFTATAASTGTKNWVFKFFTDTGYATRESSDTAGVSVAVSKATPTLSVGNSPVTYGGTAKSATVSASVGGSVSNIKYDGSSTAPANAGTYAVTASFVPTDTANYSSLTDASAGNFVINKATPTATLAVSNSPQTYSGSSIAAIVTVTANSTPGTVTNVKYDGSSTAPKNVGTYAVTADFTPTDTTNFSTLTGASAGNLVINKANATVTVTPYNVTYDGNEHTATATIAGVNGEFGTTVGTVTLNTTHINAGTYASDSWSFTGTANYNDIASTTITDTITAKPEPTVTVTVGTYTYNGSAQGPGEVAVIAGGSTGSVTLSYAGTGGTSYGPSATAPTNAGTYTVTASVAADANYSAGTSSATPFTIRKATSTTLVTITGGPFTYTGVAQEPATVAVTGAGGLSLTPTATYASNTNAGTATASYTFAGDANHEGSSDSKTFTIGKANATVAVTPYSVNYDGSAHTATYTITGVNSESGATVGTIDVTATTHTNAGTYAGDAWSFTGGTNYNNASGTATNNIAKANATVTVTPYSVTYDGIAHTATYSISGVNAESGATVGTVNLNTTHTNAGTYASDSWSFTGGGNYNDIASTTITDTIAKADVTVTLSNLTQTYTGSALTPTATTTPSGLTINWTGAPQTNAGDHEVTAAVNDTNYQGSASGTFTINKATSTTSVTALGGVYTGSAIGATASAVTRAGAADTTASSFSYAGRNTTSYGPSSSAPTNAGDYTVTAAYDGDGNHSASSTSVAFTISKASSTTTVTINGAPFIYNATAQSPATVAVTGAGGLSLTPTASYANNVNAGTATASYTYAGDANHNGSADSKTFTIGKASSTTTVTIGGAPFTYNGLAQTPAVVSVTGVGGLNLTPSATYANNTNAGTATASYIYAGDANHNGSSGSQDFTIAARVGQTRYIGQTAWVTSGSNASTAQVILAASVQDSTGVALTNATVTFRDAVAGTILAKDVKVAPVVGSPGTGTANTTVSLSTGQYGSASYIVEAILTTNYSNQPQLATDYQSTTGTVTVTMPAATSTTRLAGTFAADPTRAGTYRGADNAPATLTVGLQYNKSGSNLQGQVMLRVTQADGSIVYIKSNSLTSMVVAGSAPKVSTTYSKASIYSIKNGTVTSLEGNATLRVDVSDYATGTDQVAVTVLKDSNLLYSNKWQNPGNGWVTVPENLSTGSGSLIN